MRLTKSILLASAIAVHNVVGQPLTSGSATSAASPSSTPVCGQAWESYQVTCGQSFSGNEVKSAASASSLEDCISSCDSTNSCIAASFVSGQCTLLSSVSHIANADGAQAAINAAQAPSIFQSIGSSAISSVASSIAVSNVVPTATTTTLPASSQIAAHISQGLSDNSPTITGADTQIYLSAIATSAPTASSSASSVVARDVSAMTPPSRVARAANTCTASNVVSNIAIIRAAEASPVVFCEVWIAYRPHSSTPFNKISYPPDVSNACQCIISQFAATTTCAASSVQTNMVKVRNAVPTPTLFCQAWLKGIPHSSSSISGISYPPDLTVACKCIFAGAAMLISSISTSTTKAASTTTSISTATTGAFVSNSGKRGLAYNSAALTLPFSRAGQNSQVSWAYNWDQTEYSGFNPALQYIPLLWNNAATLTNSWSANAQTAINNGATALMSFNEPDWCASGSACMSVSTAVSAYKQYMQPFAGKAKLGAPAVTNAGAPYGLTWLSEFMGNCTGCQIDFIVLHWYSNKYAGATYFEEYVNSARAVANGRPIWITEFGLDSTYSYTDAELQSFLQTVMPWMDQQSDITHYAYFMDSAGILINSNGVGMSGTGAVFNSFTNSTKQANLY